MHVYIMRGISGSGKSSMIDKIVQDLGLTKEQYKVASADSFFYNYGDGEYHFNKEMIPLAHDHCKEVFTEALENQIPHIFVDNTHTRKWEYAFYLEKARENSCQIVYVEVLPRDENDLLIAASRNLHNVPLYAIRNMWKRWEKAEVQDGEKLVQVKMEGQDLTETQIQKMNHPLALASNNPLFFVEKRHRIHLEFEDLHLRAYMRITTRPVLSEQRKLTKNYAPCLDLSSVVVYDPYKSRGNFKKLIKLCLDFCETFKVNFYVENVINFDLIPFFENHEAAFQLQRRDHEAEFNRHYWKIYNEGEPNASH